MNILFYLCPPTRATALTYENYLQTGGFSGTENCILEMAKATSDAGHNVYILCGHDLDTDIHYVSTMDKIPLKTIDVYITDFVLDDTAEYIAREIPDNTLIIIWLQCIIHDEKIHRWQQFQKPLLLVCPSDWVLDYCSRYNVKSIKIENAINPQVFSPLSHMNNKTGNFAFHASFERGGHIAMEVFKQLPFAHKMQIAQYDPKATGLPPEQINPTVKILHSLSKIQIRQMLCESDYFVYPLALPNASIHHDTFGCVVLEAMACGVIVISWDAACLRQLYGNNMILLPTPLCDGYDPNNKLNQRNPNMLGQGAIDLFIIAIKQLESSPDKKEAIRQRAYKWAIEKTWDKQAAILLNLLRRHYLQKRYLATP